MRVLVLESHPGVASEAVEALTRAGHIIERCDTADRRYPCRGLAGTGDCPLDEHVDVAVLARELGDDTVPHGALCAARSRVPVIETNPSHANLGFPTPVWTSVAGSGIVDECERAASDGRAHARAVAERLVALGVVTRDETTGPDRAVAISVSRDVNRLALRIELADSVRDRQGAIRRAATQALRDFDKRVSVIDVVLDPAR